MFEHVYDTAALLKQMHTLMKPGTPFMFAIPNPYAVSNLKREGHNGTPGLTLLPPNFWHRVFKGFTCFYHPWSYYSGLFRAMGFERIETWKAERSSVNNMRAKISAGLARAKEAISNVSMDGKSRLVLDANLADYERRLADDLAAGDPDYLAWRYLTTFWRGCAFKGGVISADVAEKPRAIHQPWAVTRRLRGLAQHIRELLDGKPRSKESVLDTSAASMVTLGPELTLVPLALSPPQLTTRWNLRSQTTVTAEGGALRCEVVAEPSGGSHYGGLCVPVARARRVRLDLELLNPAHIEAVYLDGEDGRCGRPLRWKWSQPSTHSTAREVFTLEPGRDGSTFTTVLPVGDAEVAELHLFVRVATGKRAGFVLHGLEASS